MTRTNLVLSLTLIAALGCSRDAETKKEEKPAAAVPTAVAAAAPAAEPEESCGGTMAGAAVEGEESCGGPGEGSSCGQPGSSCNQWDEEAMAVTKRKVPADAVWKTWTVDGMHCGGCERRVMAKVGELDGVVAVKANAGIGEVSVAVAPGKEATLDSVPQRIASLGYRVQ